MLKWWIEPRSFLHIVLQHSSTYMHNVLRNPQRLTFQTVPTSRQVLQYELYESRCVMSFDLVEMALVNCWYVASPLSNHLSQFA